MKEKDIQSVFRKKNKIVGIFELKICKGTSISFESVAEHQIKALLAGSSDEGVYHKISDSFIADKMRGKRFPLPKPFDCLFLKNVPAYVVICWYIPRKKKAFHYIPVRAFIEKRDTADRKSLTEQMSASIAEEVLLA